jgi:hypothetical protein
MNANTLIVNKIRELYPDIAYHRIHITATRHLDQSCWMVQFKKDKYVLNTVLENCDAALLLSGQQCMSLTVEIQQISDSLKVLEWKP